MTSQIYLSDQTINHYFYESLKQSFLDHSVSVQDDTHAYVVNVAVHYLASENLFLQDGDGHSLPTLAYLYRDALESESVRHRKNIIRTLGDTALFLAACFPNIWQRRGLGRGYFISMGESAFDYLTALDKLHTEPYRELAANFESIADCLGLAVFRKETHH